MMSTVFIAILGFWLLLSILAQFNILPWIRWVKGRDYFVLIPDWSFFAPEPAAGDLQLLYRDKLVDGQLTPWKEVAFRDISLVRALWNPEKRRRKTSLNAATLLLQQVASQPKSRELFVSLPYLFTLMHVMTMPRRNGSAYRQFLIVHAFAYHPSQEEKMLFLSSLHKLEEQPCQIALT